MSYTPHEWSTGETITAAKLNALENGVAGGMLICTYSWNEDLSAFALDKTVQEIYDAYISGTPVFVKFIYGTLGPSGTGSYQSETELAPIVRVFGYSYTDTIRVCVSRSVHLGQKNNTSYIHGPSIMMLSATSMNDYPIYYAEAYVPLTNLVV